MTHCPECGSKVAEVDVFCPYCGLALGTAFDKAEPSEESASDPTPPTVAEDSADVSGPLAGIDEPVIPVSASEVVESVQAEELSSKDEPQAAPNAQFEDTFFENSDEEARDSEPAPILNALNVTPEPSEPAASTIEENESPDFQEPSFEETVAYAPEDYEKHNLVPELNEESPSLAAAEPMETANEVAAEAASEEQSATEPEREVASESLSEGPSEPASIENVEPEPAPPLFTHSLGEDPAGESAPVAAAEDAHSEPLPASADSEAAVVMSEVKSSGSTDPNIGDTDGKKAKLKPLDDGTVLNGRYEIVRRIGGGGMGAVYLASDKNLGGVLRAVKEMVQSYIEEEQQEKAVADFKRESMLLTTLDHIGIPTIYDYFYDDKEARFYLVMKYISGGDLAARLRATPEGRINEITVTEWALQVAEVLDYLHNHQPPIVYRDLKPSNIMIDGNANRVMLVDFGIARWVNKEEKGVTAVGTMGYAPPELFSGNVEPRSDIYSLGSTMFHLLTGADPQSNPLLIFDFNKNPRPRQINSQLSDQIEQIIMKAVEYNADKRFISAAELRQTLAIHLDNLRQGKVSFGVIDTTVGVVPLSSLPVFCGFCGQKIVASDMFCPFCGAQQPISQQMPHQHSQPLFAAPALGTAKLTVLGTSELDRSEFSLDKDSNLVGRRDPMSNIFPEIDLSKYDPQTKISRRHARIWKDAGRFLVEDLGSSNGTMLLDQNNASTRLIPHQAQVLNNGDKIKVGDTTLHFVSN